MTGNPLGQEFGAEGLKRRSVRGGAVTLLAQLAKFIVQFGSQLALIRLLDPASFGLVALAAPAVSLIQVVSDLGLEQAIVQRPSVSQAQVSGLFWISAGLGLAAASLLFLLAPVYAALLARPELVGVVRVLAVLVAVSGLSAVPGALLNRRLSFASLAAVDMTALLVGTAIGVAAAVGGAGYWALVVGQAGSALVSLALTWVLVRWLPSLHDATGAGLRGILGFGAHLAGADLAAYVSASASSIILGSVIGTTELGLYDRSLRLVVGPLSQVMAPVSRVAVPVLSRLQDQGGSYVAAYLFMLQAALLVTIPGLLVLTACAAQILPSLLGPRWTGTAPVFAWVGVGGLAVSTYASTGWLLSSQGRGRDQLRRNIASAAVSVTAVVMGLWWGAAGVAAAGAVSFVLVQTPLALWIATRSGPVALRVVLAALWPFLLAGCASAVVAVLARFSAGTVWHAAASAVAAYAVFVAALLAQVSGRAFLRKLWQLRRLVR